MCLFPFVCGHKTAVFFPESLRLLYIELLSTHHINISNWTTSVLSSNSTEKYMNICAASFNCMNYHYTYFQCSIHCFINFAQLCYMSPKMCWSHLLLQFLLQHRHSTFFRLNTSGLAFLILAPKEKVAQYPWIQRVHHKLATQWIGPRSVKICSSHSLLKLCCHFSLLSHSLIIHCSHSHLLRTAYLHYVDHGDRMV
jgi:hypothetical protein